MNKYKYKNDTFLHIIQNNINTIIRLNHKYKKLGYTIYIENNHLTVNVNNSRYKISIINKNKTNYCHLNPYNNSYFETKIDNIIYSLDLVLFAINDNEIIHKKEKKSEIK